MRLPRLSSDFLERAEGIRIRKDASSLMYAALELRCGIEARLQEFASNAPGVTKKQARDWEIKKLGRTVDAAFRMGDKILILLVQLHEKPVAQFIYAPVTARLQDIGKKCGDYLHVRRDPPSEEDGNWAQLAQLLHEGCGLLRMSCSSEILCPTMPEGLHIVLAEDDPRLQAVQALQNGTHAGVHVVNITPTGPITYYPAESCRMRPNE